MKEQNKTPDKELNKTKVTNLSDAEFKTLVIRMLKEFIEYSNNIKKSQEEMKVTLHETKKNLQGTKSGGDEAGTQINDLEHKEAKNNQSEKQEVKRIQKTEGSISSLWEKFKRSNIHIMGMPEGEEKEQEIGNLLGKNN